MTTGIAAILHRREPEPRQWINGRYLPILQKAKKSPEINPGDSKLLAADTQKLNEESHEHIKHSKTQQGERHEYK